MLRSSSSGTMKMASKSKASKSCWKKALIPLLCISILLYSTLRQLVKLGTLLTTASSLKQFVVPAIQFESKEPSQQTSVNRLWSASKTMPKWMKEYFEWHSFQRKRIPLENTTSDIKYLVVQCVRKYGVCGGLSDRLRPLPMYLHHANISKRVLLINWEKPCPLEEFLVPPNGGLDWRVPPELRKDLDDKVERRPNYGNANITAIQRKKLMSNERIVTAKLQTWDAGRLYFDAEVGPADGVRFESVFRDSFRILFEPSPPVAARIDATNKRLGLSPGNYVAAHVRARYPTRTTALKYQGKAVDKQGGVKFEGDVKEALVQIAVNAVNCAVSIYPGVPVYVASDSNHVVNYMTNHSAFSKANISVVGIESSKEPLHLDTPNTTHTCPNFYSVFEEILLLGQSGCVSYGQGGYGKFGQLLSSNYTCSVNHRNHRSKLMTCPSAIGSNTR